MLSELQRVRQVQLGYGGGYAQELGHAEHDEAGGPAAAVGAIHELEAQVDAVVATVARALRVHDEQDYAAKYLVNVLFDFGS